MVASFDALTTIERRYASSIGAVKLERLRETLTRLLDDADTDSPPRDDF